MFGTTIYIPELTTFFFFFFFLEITRLLYLKGCFGRKKNKTNPRYKWTLARLAEYVNDKNLQYYYTTFNLYK